MTVIKCKNCKKEFLVSPYYAKRGQKYCSSKCYGAACVGRVIWNKGLKGIHLSPKTEWKKGQTPVGSKLFKKGRKPTREEIKKCLRKRPMSKLEIKVDRVIKKYLLPYRFVGNGEFFIENKNPDFVNVNGEKVAIEVYARKHKELFRDGGVDEWKNSRQELFGKYGWRIVFIEEWQTNTEESIYKQITK